MLLICMEGISYLHAMGIPVSLMTDDSTLLPGLAMLWGICLIRPLASTNAVSNELQLITVQSIKKASALSDLFGVLFQVHEIPLPL